ncbi:hypothetical protein [Luteolibacter luteus]|uniref:Uncharacterized protein n=1 Tax=Luteolibacter luteus TaxID=2728835 RepID=A0A858RP15_9BACT|nr:hypothetical protein [Luteolibacter luteus]QJE97870.1 hypothetical protein HHL09_19465 [Luteolibacter luteus]
MNRLVRIALTLFVSATVLIFLVLQRLQRAKEIGVGADANELSRFAKSELQMAYIGMGIVAIMLIAGVVLIITAIAKAKKKPATHG